MSVQEVSAKLYQFPVQEPEEDEAVDVVEKIPILSPYARWAVCGMALLVAAVVAIGWKLTEPAKMDGRPSHAVTCAGRTDDPVCDPYANIMWPGSTWRDLPPDRTPYIEQMLAARVAPQTR